MRLCALALVLAFIAQAAVADRVSFAYGDLTGDLTTVGARTPRQPYFPEGAPLPAGFRVLGQNATHFTAHPAGWVLVNSTSETGWMPTNQNGLFQPPFPIPSTSALFGVSVSEKVGAGTTSPFVNPTIYFSNRPEIVSATQQQSIAANKQKANLLVNAAFPSLPQAFVASDIFVFTFENTTHDAIDPFNPNEVLPFVSTLQFVLVTDGDRTFSISHYPRNNLQCPVFAGIAWGSSFVSYAPPGSSPHPSLMDSRHLNLVGNAAIQGSIVARVDTSIELPPVDFVSACSGGSCDDQNVCTTEMCLPEGTCSSSFTGDQCTNSSIPAKCALRVCDQEQGCIVYDATIDPSKQCFHPDPCMIHSCNETSGCHYTRDQTCNNPQYFAFGPSAGDSTVKFPPRNRKDLSWGDLYWTNAFVQVNPVTPFVSLGTLMTEYYLMNFPAVGRFDPLLSTAKAMYNLQGQGSPRGYATLSGEINATFPVSEEEARLGLTPNVMYYRQMTRTTASPSQLTEFELADRVVQNSFGDKQFGTKNLIVVTSYRPVSVTLEVYGLPYACQVAIAYNGPRTYAFFTGAGPDTRSGSLLTRALPGITSLGSNSDIIRVPTWGSYGTNTGNSSLARLFAFRADVSDRSLSCPCYDGDWCTLDTCDINGVCSSSAFDCASDQDCVASYCNQPEGCAASPPTCDQSHGYLDVSCTKSVYSSSEPVDCTFIPRNLTTGAQVAISFDTFFSSLAQKVDGTARSVLVKTDFIEYDANRPGGGGYAQSFRLYRKFQSTGAFFVSASSSESNSSRSATFSVFTAPAFYSIACDSQVVGGTNALLKGSTLTCTLVTRDLNNVNVLSQFSDLTFDQSQNPASVITANSFVGVPSNGLARNFSFSVSLSVPGPYVFARNASDGSGITVICYDNPTYVTLSCPTSTRVGERRVCTAVARDSTNAATYSLATALAISSSNAAVAAVAAPSPAVASTFTFQLSGVASGVATVSSLGGSSFVAEIYDIPDPAQTSIACPAVVSAGSTVSCVITPRKNNAIIYTTASQLSAFTSSSSAVSLGAITPSFGNSIALAVTGVGAGPAVINSSSIGSARTITAYTAISSVRIDCPFASISSSQLPFNCTVTPYHVSTPSKPTYGLSTDLSLSCSSAGGSCGVSSVSPSGVANRFTFEVIPSSVGSFNLSVGVAGNSFSVAIAVCNGCPVSAAVQRGSMRLNTQMPSNPSGFVQTFANDVCTAARINCSRVVVNSTLRAGSVIVDFAILPAASSSGANEPSPLAVLQDLQQQLATPGSALLSGAVTNTAYSAPLNVSSSVYVSCDNTWKPQEQCSLAPSNDSDSGLSGGSIAGIVIGSIAGAAAVVLVTLHLTGHLSCTKSETGGKPHKGIPDGLSLESRSSLTA